jgi:Cft2 family RNA processing exonuclease
MDIRAAYEAKFDIDLNNPTIFSLKEAEDTLKRVLKVNYFQVYDTERGVHLIAHPSGKNNGSCLWELQDQVTQEKILLINDISQQQWRACQPYSLPRIKLSEQQKPFHHVIFTKRGLNTLMS